MISNDELKYVTIKFWGEYNYDERYKYVVTK